MRDILNHLDEAGTVNSPMVEEPRAAQLLGEKAANLASIGFAFVSYREWVAAQCMASMAPLFATNAAGCSAEELAKDAVHLTDALIRGLSQ